MDTAEKSEVSKKESVSYDSKKDTSKRPELKSSVMAKKVERKLYPEPQVERKVSVEAVKPVVEVIKEEEEEVAEPGTEGAAVEETENSGSGSSKVSISTSVFKTHPLIYSRRTRPPSRSPRRQRSRQGMYLLTYHSQPWLATTSPSSTTSLGEARRRNPFQNLPNQSHQGKLAGLMKMLFNLDNVQPQPAWVSRCES